MKKHHERFHILLATKNLRIAWLNVLMKFKSPKGDELLCNIGNSKHYKDINLQKKTSKRPSKF